MSTFDRAAQGFANYVHDNGLKKAMLIPFGVAPVLVAVGVLPVGGALLKILVFIGGFLFYAGIFILLLRERQILKLKSRQKSEVLNRYMNTVHETQNNPNYFKYLEWDQEISIEQDGSAEIFRWCTVQAGPEPVDAIWAKTVKTFGSTRRQDKNRPKSVNCEYFHAKDQTNLEDLVISPENRKFGAGALITEAKQTLADGEESTIYAYFIEPLAPGGVVRLCFHWRWPRFAEKLLQTGNESMRWSLRQPANIFRMKMSFDKKCNGSTFRITPFNESEAPQMVTHADGRTEILLRMESTEAGYKFGFILDTSR
ncbi:hypothetical protein [Mycobacteroides abscessus]|uniref:hypothetical protein n=1 Tax=Mycobacteroides abscessus TaxID=36809 RepID=UPI000940CAAC|nr:hypothetical protein [Mycobacteroides abscessus]